MFTIPPRTAGSGGGKFRQPINIITRYDGLRVLAWSLRRQVGRTESPRVEPFFICGHFDLARRWCLFVCPSQRLDGGWEDMLRQVEATNHSLLLPVGTGRQERRAYALHAGFLATDRACAVYLRGRTSCRGAPLLLPRRSRLCASKLSQQTSGER